MSRSCNVKRVLLERYLDQELGTRQRARVEEHLRACIECRRYLSQLQLQAEMVRAPIAEAAQAADFAVLESRVAAHIRSTTTVGFLERLSVWLRELLFHHRTIWISSAATAAIVFLVLVPLLWRSPQSVTPEELLTAYVNNEVIIDSFEYKGTSSLVYTVSKNNTTVIWMPDFDRVSANSFEGEEL
jgi:anti-sigma factor RsiW